MNVLMLTPEPPYPLHSGGAYRTASLLHYFAQRAEVDLVLISETGLPCDLPAGLVRTQTVIPLPVHRKDPLSRYFRNARRAATGTPPLIDRMAGLTEKVEQSIHGKSYDLGIIEHFWCAPYVHSLEKICGATLVNLHNVESVLHDRCAGVSAGLVKIGHKRFAAASRALETELIPRFSHVLVTSEADMQAIHEIAPQAHTILYPNAIPGHRATGSARDRPPSLAFSANFEYHPNIDAVQFLLRDIWPRVRQNHPDLKLRLVGRGDGAIRHLLPPDRAARGIEVTGRVPDALHEIARSTIYLAPLRAGSGTRIKILEAWAAELPVIATPIAAEGLNVVDGENALLASTGDEFARAVGKLLASDADRLRLSLGGRSTLEHNYSWQAAWAMLDIHPQLMRNSGLKRYTGTSHAIRR